MITIYRKIQKDDILKGHVDLYKQLSNINSKNEMSIDKYESFVASLDDDHLIYVVESDNCIIGTITILIEQKLIRDMGKVAHIEDVVVDSKYRGNNIGNMLIKIAIEHAKERKCYKIILDCAEGVKGFYEKCGFICNGAEMAIYL